MEIETRDFGKIEINEEEVILFPWGIPGFADKKEFVLLNVSEDSPFIIMQSVEDPELAFITMDPWNVCADYEFEIDKQTQRKLRIKNKDDVLVLTIATVRKGLEDMTINLAAPIVVNVKEKLGKQIILDRENFSVHYPVFGQKNERREAR